MTEAQVEKRRKKRREEPLSAIREQRSLVEEMAQRPRQTDDALDTKFLEERLKRLTEIENKAQDPTNTDTNDDLICFAEQQGALRAYICPVADIELEATLVIDLLEECGVPKTAIQKLSKSYLD